MKSAICTEFVRVSEYVHDWCQKQSSVGEESITDWILFEFIFMEYLIFVFYYFSNPRIWTAKVVDLCV
jgi:hypothetical protein